jgi:hypothetical protein
VLTLTEGKKLRFGSLCSVVVLAIRENENSSIEKRVKRLLSKL